MEGPECDWCKCDEEDLDVYTVGDDFLCEDCLRLASTAPNLLIAIKALVEAVNNGSDGHYPGLSQAIDDAEATIRLANGG